jgi:methyltransferase family protein
MAIDTPLVCVDALAQGFDDLAFPLDLGGWGSNAPIFLKLITQKQPTRIIEVGSWKGASAIHMAECCAALSLQTEIICVDTWLGALEMWTDMADSTRYGSLKRNYGYPTLYYQFLANVIKSGNAERIIPFPQTSIIAARALKKWGITADIIYIDGSHDEIDVTMDIEAYTQILNQDGIMFGDDWSTWESVKRGVKASGIKFDVYEERWWVKKAAEIND